tara:strand:+ start:11191 stop:12369 length:1179 start_codon:yes stop_codon:yes gene_type:complete
MNILIANTQEFNPLIGGVERVSNIIAKILVERGYKVIFVASYISRHDLDYIPNVKQYLLSKELFYNIENSEYYINEFVKIVNDEKIDIVINQAGNILDFSNLCFQVKIRTKIKLISNIHINPDYRLKNLDVFSDLTFYQWLNPKILRKFILYPFRKKRILKKEKSLFNELYNMSDATVLLSSLYFESFTKISGIKDNTKLFSILNPIPFQVERGKISKKQILYVGRIDYSHKRTDRLLKIWSYIYKKHKGWDLKIVGDGPNLNDLKRLSKKLKLKQISFEGFKDPKKYYNESQIICLTSNIEGLPMVMIEAISYGLVPIAFNSFESINDIIFDQINGFLIEPFNYIQFADRLSNLMNDESLRKEMSVNALKTSKKFSVKNIIDQWEILFSRI